MANALAKEAPSKIERAEPTKEELALSQQFDVNKRYVFELAVKNLERELPVINMVTKRPAIHKPFKPFQNIVLSSQIVWKGQRRNIRYYDGCTSIFTEDQPKEKDTIDQLIRQTRRRDFIDGKFSCFGDERLLLLYLNICSWNGESEFKTRTSDTVFIPSNKDKQATIESKRLDEQEEALRLAKEASETKMMIHAHYLGIPLTDYDSGNELSVKEIRTEYRKRALQEPSKFISSYGNKAIETKYYIDKALEQGLITNKFNPNKATWSNSNTEICDISGLRSSEAIGERLLEFSQLEEGQEFQVQLRALFNQ